MPHRLTPLDASGTPAVPCPFCGEPVLDIETHQDYYILCQACGARGPLCCTEDEAVQRWNYRWSRYTTTP
jgi:Lar family restriction alleviation protein